MPAGRRPVNPRAVFQTVLSRPLAGATRILAPHVPGGKCAMRVALVTNQHRFPRYITERSLNP
jgi:hypothetical protein